MSRIAVFTASELEFNTVQSLLSNWQPDQGTRFRGLGWAGENRISLFATAMGPRSAAAEATRALSQCDAELVLITGLAGGLAEQSRCGDLVLYRHCYYRDQEQFPTARIKCNGGLNDQLQARLPANDWPRLTGDGLTIPQVLCRVADKRQAASDSGAIAVDMESYQILTAAREAGRAATVLRVVSDDLNAELPDLNAGIKPDGGVDNFRMIKSLVAHPLWSIRFLINLRRAVKVLTKVLPVVLSTAYESASAC